MKNTEYGPNQNMKNGWLMIYTRIKPWFSILIGLIFAFVMIPANLDNFTVWWITGYCTLPVLAALVSFLCLSFANMNYKKYVKLLKISLFVDLFTLAFLMSVDMMNILWKYSHLAVGWFILVFLVGYPTWFKLNVKYFEARVVDPEAEERVMQDSFFRKVDGINKRNAAEKTDEYGFKK